MYVLDKTNENSVTKSRKIHRFLCNDSNNYTMKLKNSHKSIALQLDLMLK